MQPIARARAVGKQWGVLLRVALPNPTIPVPIGTYRPAADVPGGSKFVVGYDGSEPAKRALESAAARAGDQTLIVVVAASEPYPR